MRKLQLTTILFSILLSTACNKTSINNSPILDATNRDTLRTSTTQITNELTKTNQREEFIQALDYFKDLSLISSNYYLTTCLEPKFDSVLYVKDAEGRNDYTLSALSNIHGYTGEEILAKYHECKLQDLNLIKQYSKSIKINDIKTEVRFNNDLEKNEYFITFNVENQSNVDFEILKITATLVNTNNQPLFANYAYYTNDSFKKSLYHGKNRTMFTVYSANDIKNIDDLKTSNLKIYISELRLAKDYEAETRNKIIANQNSETMIFDSTSKTSNNLDLE